MSRRAHAIDHESFLAGASQRDIQRVQDALYDEERAALEMEKMAMRKVHAACAKIEQAASEFCPSDYIETGASSFFFWARREGREVWADKAFRKAYLRDNPECRRKVRSLRTVITAATPWQKMNKPAAVKAAQPLILH
jgi:hypothetical protein